MTRRERKERRLERRLEWASSRDSKAAALFARGDPYRGDIAFATQPGHIPERARVIAAFERGCENAKVASHHREVAHGIERQLETSVFSDDPDAIEALKARIAENEAKRDKMKKINSLYRKGDATGLEALGLNLESLKAKMQGAYSWEKAPYPQYSLTNLGARIRADKERIKVIESRNSHVAEAEANGGVAIRESGEYSIITFAEKPEREVIEALKTAGYWWGNGSWSGKTEAMPAICRQMHPSADISSEQTETP